MIDLIKNISEIISNISNIFKKENKTTQQKITIYNGSTVHNYYNHSDSQKPKQRLNSKKMVHHKIIVIALSIIQLILTCISLKENISFIQKIVHHFISEIYIFFQTLFKGELLLAYRFWLIPFLRVIGCVISIICIYKQLRLCLKTKHIKLKDIIFTFIIIDIVMFLNIPFEWLFSLLNN